MERWETTHHLILSAAEWINRYMIDIDRWMDRYVYVPGVRIPPAFAVPPVSEAFLCHVGGDAKVEVGVILVDDGLEARGGEATGEGREEGDEGQGDPARPPGSHPFRYVILSHLV